MKSQDQELVTSLRPCHGGWLRPRLRTNANGRSHIHHTGWGPRTYSHSAYQCVELLCRRMQTKANTKQNRRRTRIYLRGMLSGVYGQYYIIIDGLWRDEQVYDVDSVNRTHNRDE